MEEALRRLERDPSCACPDELKNLPFALIRQDDGEVELTSVIDRITKLSKGYDSDLHARRFLRLKPMLLYFQAHYTK